MEQTLPQLLGAAVREARQRQELTQADVAERIGLATEVYGRLERGHMLPSVRTLLKICTVLHVSADKTLGLENLERPVPTPDTPREPKESREVRRLVRSLRDLDAAKLRLIGQVANALKHC
jgi:transcriptional regulator with XRE-family HTH domain